jgi:hypothetical protein
MSAFKIGPPNPSSGGFDKDRHNDHLLAFVQPRAEQQPSFSDSTKMQTVARSGFVVCVDCGTASADVLWFTSQIVPRLLDTRQDVVVGRLGQGLARAGRSAPWLLDEPTDADLVEVGRFLEKHATRLKSGVIVVEAPEEGDDDDIDDQPDDDEPF